MKYPVPEGPGLKHQKNNKRWYGNGCRICGQTSCESQYSPLIPQKVRFWDADDGWRLGVLCLGCAEEAAMRGPQVGDCAYREEDERPAIIDAISELSGDDIDGAVAELEDMLA